MTLSQLLAAAYLNGVTITIAPNNVSRSVHVKIIAKRDNGPYGDEFFLDPKLLDGDLHDFALKHLGEHLQTLLHSIRDID